MLFWWFETFLILDVPSLSFVRNVSLLPKHLRYVQFFLGTLPYVFTVDLPDMLSLQPSIFLNKFIDHSSGVILISISPLFASRSSLEQRLNVCFSLLLIFGTEIIKVVSLELDFYRIVVWTIIEGFSSHWVGINVDILYLGTALAVVELSTIFDLGGFWALDECVEVDGLMPLLPYDTMDKFFIKIVRANVSIACKSQFEILLEEQIVSSRTFILYIVLQISFSLERSEVEILHQCYNFVINRNLLKTHVYSKTVDLCECSEPRVLPYLW